MGDWEQPSTSLELGRTAEQAGGDDHIQMLRQQLGAAMVRIEALEQRIGDLENRVSGQREQAQGA